MAYSSNGSGLWKAFASLVLEASYEAALIAAALAVPGSQVSHKYLGWEGNCNSPPLS